MAVFTGTCLTFLLIVVFTICHSASILKAPNRCSGIENNAAEFCTRPTQTCGFDYDCAVPDKCCDLLNGTGCCVDGRIVTPPPTTASTTPSLTSTTTSTGKNKFCPLFDKFKCSQQNEQPCKFDFQCKVVEGYKCCTGADLASCCVKSVSVKSAIDSLIEWLKDQFSFPPNINDANDGKRLKI